MTTTLIDNDAHGIVLESGAMQFKRLLPGPIERVWSYLVEPEKRKLWLAAGPMDLRVGGRAVLEFHNGALAPQGEPVPEDFQKYSGRLSHGGRITELDPPRRLAMTWGEKLDGTDPTCNADAVVHSEVVFELLPQGRDVLLVLTHRKLSGPAEKLSISGGWHVHLAHLVAAMKGEPKPAFWAALARLRSEYERRFA
jgi:uncharacterized protein YndB with AHSA1/START domain